jgi:alpha-1,2-mannosyltransferase
MTLQLFVPLFAAIVICVIALYVAWHSHPKLSCLPPGHHAPLLDQSFRLLMIFVVSGVLVTLLCAMLSANIRETTIAYLFSYTLRHAGHDSWWPMSQAIQQLRDHPNTPLYSELFFKNKIKFQYPPSALLFLDIPQRITGLSWESMRKAGNLVCWLCVPAIGLAFFSLLKSAVLSSSIEEGTRLTTSSLALLILLSLAIVGTFYPLLRSYTLGQIQTPVTLIAGLALIAWQRRQFRLAGFLIGLSCGIKPQWLVIIPWAILRRQWKMVLVSTVTAGILLLLSIAAYGLHNVVDYLSVLSFLSKHGESYSPNQSVNGLMNRLLFNGNNLNWAGDSFPSFHPMVYALTLSSSILILGVAMFWRMFKNPSSLDLALIMLSLTIASPIAWEHHYGILLPIFALALPIAIFQRSFGAWTTVYLWLAFILTSQTFRGITDHLANTRWNVLQSTLFFGAMMVLLLLYRISYLQQNAERENQAE